MPVFAFFAVVGFALIAPPFVADATLERNSPVIVTSDRVGLPERWHPDTIQTLTTAPAPPPDMTSQAVLVAQPKSEPRALERIGPQRAQRGRKRHPKIIASGGRIDHRQNRLVSTDFLLKVSRAVMYCNVRFGRLADILRCRRRCPLYPQSGHVQRNSACPLCANSGHSRGAMLRSQFQILRYSVVAIV